MNATISLTKDQSKCAAVEVPDILLIVIGSAAALMNGLLLLVLYNERKKFFRTRVSHLVANLALTDCFTGIMLLLVMALGFAKKEKLLHGYQFFLLSGSIQCSFCTLLLMSLDRLIVAMFPMTWSNILTKRNTITGIIFAWGFAIFGIFMLKYKIEKRRFALLLFLEITAVLIIMIHVAIFQVLRRQRRDLSQSNSSADIATTVDLTLQACHAQITSVVLTLILVLVVTYTPYIVFSNILLAKQGTDMKILVYDDKFRYAQAFSYLNYAANPIVYAWRLRVYRKALCQLVLKMAIS